MVSYAQAGVNINRVKRIHREIEKLIAHTFKKNILPIFGHYGGLIRFGNTTLAIHTDGVGSKVLIAQYINKYNTIGIDAVAMNVNDIICLGAKPLALVNYIALEKEDERLVKEIMKGLVKGAKEADISIVGGETAILPDVIKGIKGKVGFDLAATCVGKVKKLILGDNMKEGDVIIGLHSSGIHSNGITLARKVLDIEKWGKELLKPTKIYVRSILNVLKKVDIKGMAHITGGGFSKLKRIGKRAKKGFLLNGLPEPHKVFKEMEKKVKKREMYKTFNMGIGFCIITEEEFSEDVIKICKKNRQSADIIGKIIKNEGVIIQANKTKIFL